MSKMGITITGSKELSAKLAKLGDALAGEKLEAAVTSGALLIANAAKQAAPYKTGNLRRSVHVGGHTDQTPDFAAGKGYSDVGGNTRSAQRAEVVVGTNLKYAAIQEFGGTIKHPGGTPYIVTEKGVRFLKKDGSYPKGVRFTQPHAIPIPARPYLRPAFDNQKDAAVAEVGAALKVLLREVVG